MLLGHDRAQVLVGPKEFEVALKLVGAVTINVDFGVVVQESVVHHVWVFDVQKLGLKQYVVFLQVLTLVNLRV